MDNKYDQMNIFANSVLEPGQSPTTLRADDSLRIVDGDNFWARLKRKFKKKQ